MQYTMEKRSPILHRLRITVPAGTVNAALRGIPDGTTDRTTERGKAPLSETAPNRPADPVCTATEALVDRALSDVFALEGVQPVGVCGFEGGRLVRDEPFTFAVSFEVLPEIDLPPDLSALEVDVPPPALEPGTLRSVLRELLEKDAPLQEVADRPLDGDIVRLDLSGSIDGKTVPGMAVSAGRFKVRPDGTRRNAWGMDLSAIVRTMRPGETRQGAFLCPRTFPAVWLRGREVGYTVRLHGVDRPRLPALDDALARQKGFDSARALQRWLFTRVMAIRLKEIREEGRQRLLRALLADQTFPLPETLMNGCMREYMAAAADGMRRCGLDGAGPPARLDGVREAARRVAERQVRAEVFLLALARRERLAVSEEEVAAYIERMAEEGVPGRGILRESLERQGALPELRNRLLAARALDRLYDRARKVISGAGENIPPRPPCREGKASDTAHEKRDGGRDPNGKNSTGVAYARV